MKYTLLAYFLLTGDAWIEREGLSLQSCAGHAALARTALMADLPKLNPVLGDVRFVCLPDGHALAKAEVME